MFLNSLELRNFRNYAFCKIDFGNAKTLLTGKNAQGKSNLIEAVYFLSTLKAKRTSNDTELLKKNTNEALVKAVVTKNETSLELAISLKTACKKTLQINAQKKHKSSQFIGCFKTVSFTYEDLLLLRGAPQDRRNWIDDAISQLYPSYKERLAKYNKIRIQRNNLLSSFKGNPNISRTQTDLLETWNRQLVITGSNIVHLRMKYLTEIQPLAASFQSNLTEDTEKLTINYKSTIVSLFNPLKNNILTPEEIANLYDATLVKSAELEIIRAQTLIGPHRDDIIFCINDYEAEKYASQGQQRSVVLSLKLAELNFIKLITDETPVLLLDDVMAELDKHRQNYLLQVVDKSVQTIITAAEITAFDPSFLNDIDIYTVENGEVLF
jgi:DNA replication and repair protein RecF